VAGVVMAIGGDTQGELLKEKNQKKEIGLSKSLAVKRKK
jgi:hypothetical protein